MIQVNLFKSQTVYNFIIHSGVCINCQTVNPYTQQKQKEYISPHHTPNNTSTEAKSSVQD
jgi:hypothetical protein